MLLVVDNGSVYTKNLIDFLSNKKTNFNVLTHEELDISQIDQFDSFILSGRRKNNQIMNAKNSKIIKHAILTKKSLLGICYGAEILALTTGGTIRKTNFSKGEQEIIITKQNPLCTGKIIVHESHSYEVSRLGDSLFGIAKSGNCLYEIIQYKNLNIFGTQFHPEMSLDGTDLINNFLSI